MTKAFRIEALGESGKWEVAAEVADLRERLPRRVDLLAGGSGADVDFAGVQRFSTLSDLDVWARRIVA